MARAASWLSDFLNLTRLYLVAGACLVPWAVAYALAQAHGWNSPAIGYGLFAVGIVTALVVWNRVERSRKPSAFHVENVATLGKAYTLEITGHFVVTGHVAVRLIQSVAATERLATCTTATSYVGGTVALSGMPRPGPRSSGRMLKASPAAVPVRRTRAAVLQY